MLLEAFGHVVKLASFGGTHEPPLLTKSGAHVPQVVPVQPRSHRHVRVVVLHVPCPQPAGQASVVVVDVVVVVVVVVDVVLVDVELVDVVVVVVAVVVVVVG